MLNERLRLVKQILTFDQLISGKLILIKKVKEASEPDAGKKVDLETFMPPDFSPEKKDSLPSRRPSGTPGEPKP